MTTSLPSKFKVGLIQMSMSADPEANLAKAVARIKDAAQQGANLVCLPELFRTQYIGQREDHALFDLAEPVPGPTSATLEKVAREITGAGGPQTLVVPTDVSRLEQVENLIRRAHVTFARIRESWPPEAVEQYRREVTAWTFPPWLARSCVLFESRLGPEGAVHTPLYEWTFQGGPRGVRA